MGPTMAILHNLYPYLLWVLLTTTLTPAAGQTARITQIQPYYGGRNGAVRITISGEGFADSSQFDYSSDNNNNNEGNSVQMVSSTQSFPCDVEKDASHSNLLTCNTRAMPQGYYSVQVSVNGNLVPCYYWWYGCYYYADSYYTPSITSIAPLSGLPGSMITISGNIFTDVYGSSTAHSSNGVNARILRTYAGGMPCELLAPNSDTLYGLQLTSSNAGTMICKMTGTYVGHHNVSFIVDSLYGRSSPERNTYFVSSLNKIAMFQTYAVVSSISPSAGSIQGGSLLTVTGQYFDATDQPISVFVGGKSCEVQAHTDGAITCVAPTKPTEDQLNFTSVFPGGRGLMLQVWNNTNPSRLEDALMYNENTTGYAGASWVDSASYKWPLGQDAFVARLSGFFVPPKSDNYTFIIKGGVRFSLYFSQTGNPQNKVRIANGDNYWYYYWYSARSQAFLLQKGKEYYIEIYAQHYNNGYYTGFVEVGLFSEFSSYTNDQFVDAANEVQALESTSDVVLEKQVITLENWTMTNATEEVQAITIACAESCYLFSFALIYDTEKTIFLSADASDLEVESALNDLLSIKPDTVEVTKTDAIDEHIYTVTFHSHRGDFNLLNYEVAEGSNMTIDIVEQTKGIPSMQDFTLMWDGVPSQPIAAQASASEVQAAIKGMISSSCPDSIANVIENQYVKYFNNYETEAVGWSGARTTEIEAFCGRYTMKNPNYVFYSGYYTTGGQQYGAISLTSTNKFCFAYRGFLYPHIQLYFYYDGSDFTRRSQWEWFPYDFAQQDSWSYTCINLLDLIQTRYPEGTNYDLYIIYLQPRDAAHPLYVDAVYIGQTVTTDDQSAVRQRRLPALVSGGIAVHLIDDIHVDETQPSSPDADKQYTVTISSLGCVFDIPLLAVAFAQDYAIDGDNIGKYRGSTWPSNSVITVKRTQAASPPINGTFDIEAYGSIIRGLRVDISAVDLKFALQSIPEMGQVRVSEWYRRCSGYGRTIEWVTASGKQPILQVDDSNTTGINARTTASEHVQGGLLRRTILGDMLRTPHSQPQITVLINGIPSRCSGNCNYSWDPAKTPVISGIDPTEETVTEVEEGSGIGYLGLFEEGRNLTIIGSGFADSTGNDNTSVSIGPVRCPIISVSESKIVCRILSGKAGSFPVIVYIAERGLAQPEPNKTVRFTYKIHVSNISPDRGSPAGGTLLTITGSGFDEQSQVSVNGNPCEVIRRSLTEIQCITPPGQLGNTRVDVFVNGLNVTLTGHFLYTSAVYTSVITDVFPNTSSVLGNRNLTLFGSNFGNALADTRVYIGVGLCPVLEMNSTHVVCLLPSLPPGTYPVLLKVGNLGFASVSDPLKANITYILEVNSISPQHGSVYGGTKITITGSGFSTEPGINEVQLDSTPCQVTSSAAESLECIVQSRRAAHLVTNNGRDLFYGLGYAWSPAFLDISVGDTVTWQWEPQPSVVGLSYRVYSVSSPGSTVYDGEGFQSSGARQESGSYSYRFTSPGVYYYSSGSASNSNSFSLQGRVTVLPVPERKAQLHVRVGGQEALYNPAPAPAHRQPSAEDCRAQEPECSQLPNGTSSENTIFFEFSNCYSASITGITPSSGTLLDPITITGSGFSNISCANEVKIGSYPCLVFSSSEYELTCTVDPQNTMNIGVAEMVSLNVQNLGAAISTLAREFDRRFVLLPHIDSVTPSIGSLTGKTRLTIHGSGFAAQQSGIIVAMSGYPCAIVSVNYTDIECDSPEAYVERSLDLKVVINGIPAKCKGSCTFSYSTNVTSRISSVVPTILQNVSTELVIEGEGFGSRVEDILVYIGDEEIEATDITENNITCLVAPLPAGVYTLTVVVLSKGLATGRLTLSSPAAASLSPHSGSIKGGTPLLITGNGFATNRTRVTIDGNLCEILSVTPGELHCITPAHYEGAASVQILVNSVQYPPLSFTYAASHTPHITSIFPTTGVAGTTVTISGSGLGSVNSDVTVTIDKVACVVQSVNDSEVQCVIGNHMGGNFPVVFHHAVKGYAVSNIFFMYAFSIDTVFPNEGSFGGGQLLRVNGTGFDSNNSRVFICTSECRVNQALSNLSTLFCEVPPNNGTGDSESCSVRVINGGDSITYQSPYTYRASLTPTISDVMPRRGGTGGGTHLTITGTGFSSEDVDVTIAGDECAVLSANNTHIICRTAAHSPSQRTKVKVNIGGKGMAKLDHADFFYIDVWSSNYTWGGESPPEDGSLAVITQGQTILLDANTAVLKMLVIQGGTLMFDEADIELQAENILITEGGVLQIGTEGAPFQHKAIITLHGHLRSKELPLYGAKTLAVRGGILDLHGLPVPVTWTRLAQTAEARSSTLILQDAVTWKVGDEIVIASTGNRLSQRQNEKRIITQVSEDGRRLTISNPLTYKHLGISVSLTNGKVFEARAEVGLLTRNILIRGSDNVEWHDDIAACPEGFDPGEFATQTCFQGRFGEETGSDQFGGCIMFHAPQPNKQLAVGRIEYVEVFHAGQAFRLGRHPIHWHLMGDMQFTSYVRGCAIHQTYNRAVSIHNTHHLLVENNVIYDIMGGAFVIEDGIEHGNVLQYNLAVFVKQSTSLLNDDITPAAFWVTNPNNTIRHNAAAGGTHFGFWYRMHDHPDQPSYDPTICQKQIPLGEFYNNTVHSQGWFGIWIFESYFPTQGGTCYSSTPKPAVFDSLTTWNCQKGAEWTNGGALHFRNFLMVNNENAGIETKKILLDYVGGWGETNGAVIKNAIIVGYLDELGLGSSFCSSRGLILPFDEGLTVSSTKFINFDRSCAAIGVTSAAGVCTDRCGGWSAKFDGIQFVNTSNKAGFRWEHEIVLIDVDGSLTGAAGRKVVPRSPLLNPLECSRSAEWSFGFDGFICNSSVSFHRLAVNNPSPSSLTGRNAILSNAYGVTTVPYASGWMALLPNANSINWYFHGAEFITNISYTATFYGFKPEDYVIISHNFTQRPDGFHIIDWRNGSQQLLNYSSNINGDWNFDNNTKTLAYLVAGQKNLRARRAIAGTLDPTMTNINVNLIVYRCYYKDCIPPPTQPPYQPNGGSSGGSSGGQSSDPAHPGFEINYWSNNSFWLNNSMSVPTNGSDVVIPAGKWVIADIQTPTLEKLTIYGVLELINLTEPSSGFKTVVLTATYISIQGGRLIGGWENNPFQGELHIVLKGNHSTPETPLPSGPIQGAKVLGVFGVLDLHGIPRSVYKTKLSQTASAGSRNISLVDEVDWMVGEDIVITTTSYDARQTETRRIVDVSHDRRILTLNQSLSFGHIAETHQVAGTNVSYTLAADVGLLSRNIKIIGEDYPGWYQESFGARVLVSRFTANGRVYRGSARIKNVEFYHSGQEGHRDEYDPRYSLAFLNLNEVQPNESYVQGCAFHNGFSPAIGVFGTNGLNIDDNIIHFTVGEGIRLWGQRNKARRNLVTLAICPSTYQVQKEINSNLLWHAGIEINNGRQIVLQDNIVAGFERVAYRINGEPCSGASNSVEQWSNNEAHGGLYGVYMQGDGLPGCSLIQGFTLWRCWDYGIYFQTAQSVQIKNVSLVDNGMGIFSIIYAPSATTHARSNKTVAIKSSLLVGSSPNFNCSDVLTNRDANIELSSAHRSTRPPNGGRSGICWPTFASGPNGAPGTSHAVLSSYNAITGLMTVEDSLFVGFKNVCSVETNVMFMTNPLNEDLQHPVHVSGIQMADTANEAKIFIHRPDVGKANPSDCVDMVCDAKRKALLKDLDGSLLGNPGAVVAQSEYQWGGVQSYGIGDYRIPKVMLTHLNGSRIPVKQIAPNKGIIRDSTCVYMSTWEGYNCSGLDYEMLVIESLDSDMETRRLSPVAVLGDGYIDLINGPQDHGWCSGSTCRKRISLFHSIVASGKHFDIFFTSTTPQKLRLMLLNADDTKAVRVAIYYSNPQRLDVFVNNAFVGPKNAEWNADRTDFTYKEPKYPEEFLPALNSATHGENYFDSTYQMLYILLRGSTPVEVRTSPLLMIGFNLPAMTVDQFYEGKNLVNNLAIFLKIPASKIRITKIIAASSKRRKRATGLSVTVQISDPPTLMTNDSANTTGQLQYAELQNISQSIAEAAVTGSLSSSLNITVASVAVKEPPPPPDDPKWQQLASTEVTERTEEAASFVSTVTKLVVITQPEAGFPGELLTQQPSIQAVDDNNICVAVDASALTLTAKLMNSENAYSTGGLTGNTTISFSSCWANYTDLVLVPSGTGYKIEFSLNNVLAQTKNFNSRSSAVPSPTPAPTQTLEQTPTASTTTKKNIAVDPINSASGVSSGLAFQVVVLFFGLWLGTL
ncbi:fibrocystin-L-like isoform X2 [Pleurodeles waltl]|uniref:fibrocystin-L-like isoform X2 n=1 Tax=Pleurodeles waltl TaxID=8319 RepID=UPI00370977D0